MSNANVNIGRSSVDALCHHGNRVMACRFCTPIEIDEYEAQEATRCEHGCLPEDDCADCKPVSAEDYYGNPPR